MATGSSANETPGQRESSSGSHAREREQSDSPPARMMDRTVCLSFAMVVVALVGLSAYWIVRDTAAPSWDQAWYLEHAVRFWRTLKNDGVVPFLAVFARSFGIKAPLISVLPLPFFSLFGPGEDVALIANLCMIALLNVSLFGIVGHVSSARNAPLTAFIAGTMPLMFTCSHEFLVECGLTALVTLWIYLLLKSDLFSVTGYKVLLGIVLGLGLLMKVSFPLYVCGPAMVALLARIRRHSFRRLVPVLQDVSLVAVIGYAVASIWYVPNFPSVMRFAFSTSFGKIAGEYGMGSPWSLVTMMRYLRQVANYGISLYYAALFCIALAIWFSRKVRTKQRPAIDTTRLVALAWLLVPLAVCIVGKNKDIRYLAPSLPVVALAISCLLGNVLRGRAGRIAVVLACVFPLTMTVYMVLPAEQLNLSVEYKRLVLIPDKTRENPAFPYSPREEKWPIEAMLEFIDNDARHEKGPTKAMLVVGHHYINHNTLWYYTVLHGHPLEVLTAGSLPKGATVSEINVVLEDCEYVISKTGYRGPDFLNDRNAAFWEPLEAGSLPFRLVKSYDLPDDSVAEVYKRSEW